MIRRPRHDRGRRLRIILVSAMPGIIGGLVILVGSAMLHANAVDQLTQAKIRAATAVRPPSLIDIRVAINRVNAASSMLADAIATRNAAVASIARLDRLAGQLPTGTRLVSYSSDGAVTVEALDQGLLGETATRWAALGFTLTVATTQLGQPGSNAAPPIEPNMQLSVADRSAPGSTPGPSVPAAAPTPWVHRTISLPGGSR